MPLTPTHIPGSLQKAARQLFLATTSAALLAALNPVGMRAPRWLKPPRKLTKSTTSLNAVGHHDLVLHRHRLSGATVIRASSPEMPACLQCSPILGRAWPRCSRSYNLIPRRSYAAHSAGAPRFQVFNRRTKWLHKERAASKPEQGRQADYLKDEVAIRVSERLLDINRHFPRVLDLGANSCNLARALVRDNPDPDPSKPESPRLSTRISELVAADSSESMLYRDAQLDFDEKLNITRQVLEDEESLPFDAESFDLVLSSLSLHWINDLPGILAQVNNILKPDCPFVGAMLGGDTLFELRTSLQLAEQERRGGISPHVSPLADVRDVGGLLQKAGFKMLTVDVDDIIVDYPDTFALMQDLQAMAENNAILGREMGPIGRDVLMANDAIYRAMHGNEDGSIPATFRIIYMIGWKEGENQPKPLARGSGEVNLKDILQET